MPSPFTDQKKKKKRKKMTIVSCAENIFAPIYTECIEGLYPFLFLSFVFGSPKYFAL